MPRGKATSTRSKAKTTKQLKYDEKTVQKLRSINASDDDIYRFEHPYLCTCCGKRFKTQASNFPYVQSALCNGNNHYSAICNKCADDIYNQYLDLFKFEDDALERVCMKMDMYYNRDIADAAKKQTMNISLLKRYIRNLNLVQNKGKTFDTYLSEKNLQQKVDSYDDVIRTENGERVVTKTMFERWQGNTQEDIYFLEDHYRMLKKTNPNADANQEIFIKDLCTIKLLQSKAMKERNISEFEKCTKMYRETFKQAGLKTVQEEDASTDNPLGVNAEIISQYAPEEFYRGKALYKDHDHIGEYFNEHVLRPLKNLMFNDDVQSKKYSIGDKDEST